MIIFTAQGFPIKCHMIQNNTATCRLLVAKTNTRIKAKRFVRQVSATLALDTCLTNSMMCKIMRLQHHLMHNHCCCSLTQPTNYIKALTYTSNTQDQREFEGNNVLLKSSSIASFLFHVTPKLFSVSEIKSE